MNWGFEIWIQREPDAKFWVLHELCFELREAVRLGRAHLLAHPELSVKIEPVRF